MDNQTAKEILSAYRPGGEDAADPVFRDALAQCESDPEMRAWFSEQRTFDQQVASALGTIRAPEAGKRAILEISKVEQTPESQSPAFWRRRGTWLTLAACLALAFFSIVSVNRLQQPQHPASSPTGLTDMIAAAMPLEFRHRDIGRVLEWLEARGAPVPAALASKITATPSAGCRIFNMPGGGTVSLICLEVERQLVHVFIYDGQARQHFKGPINDWWQESGYHLIAKPKDGQLVAYATRADPESIHHLL